MKSPTTIKQSTRIPMSMLRKLYFAKLVFRIIALVVSVLLFFFKPGEFDIINGWNFFHKFSFFHILWLIWIFDMAAQLIPMKKCVPLGSQKLFKQHFLPIRKKINRESVIHHIKSMTVSAYKVMVLWITLITVIGVLYFTQVIDKKILLLITVLFYVCDLICVLIWCPFRLIMKNRCCTTCRIFNWDHLMMFSPIIFMGGFFAITLVLISLAVWILWELCVLLFPERFWEKSNEALKCSNCTDKLCTQYCQKLRR